MLVFLKMVAFVHSFGLPGFFGFHIPYIQGVQSNLPQPPGQWCPPDVLYTHLKPLKSTEVIRGDLVVGCRFPQEPKQRLLDRAKSILFSQWPQRETQKQQPSPTQEDPWGEATLWAQDLEISKAVAREACAFDPMNLRFLSVPATHTGAIAQLANRCGRVKRFASIGRNWSSSQKLED